MAHKYGNSFMCSLGSSVGRHAMMIFYAFNDLFCLSEEAAGSGLLPVSRIDMLATKNNSGH